MENQFLYLNAKVRAKCEFCLVVTHTNYHIMHYYYQLLKDNYLIKPSVLSAYNGLWV